MCGDGPRKSAAFGRAGFSPSDRNLIDAYANGGVTITGYPIRDDEFVGEATCQLVLAPWLTFQFDAQHIVRPGGHVLATQGSRTGLVIKDETIVGMRTQIKF